MKRIFLFALCLLCLSFCACSVPEVEEPKEEGPEKIDLFKLDAKALYEFAYDKTEALRGAKYETSLSLEGEEAFETITTVLLREGYDGFSLSREGTEKVYFADGTLSSATALGAFSAKASTRQAKEYLAEYFFPVTCPSPEEALMLTKEETTLSFSYENAAALKLLAAAVPEEKGEFIPEKATATVLVGEDGLFSEVTCRVEGTLSGEAAVLNLVTRLSDPKADENALGIPAEEFQPLGDIRVPHYLASSIEKLENSAALQATFLFSEAVTTAEKSFALYGEETLMKKSESEVYSSRQTLKQLPEVPEENRFSQILLKDGKKIENEYDLATATLLNETESEEGFDAKELLSFYLPAISDLAETEFSESGDSVTVRFSLSAKGLEAAFRRLADRFPESTLSTDLEGSGSGVFTISAESGNLQAVSFSASGSNTISTAQASYSVTVESTEGVEIIELQVPTPATEEEGAQGDHVHE